MYTCEICRQNEADLPCPSCGRYACERCWLGSVCLVCAAGSPAQVLFPDESGVAYLNSLRKWFTRLAIIAGLLLPPIAICVGIGYLLSPDNWFRVPVLARRYKEIARPLAIAGLVGAALWGILILLIHIIPALRPYRLF